MLNNINWLGGDGFELFKVISFGQLAPSQPGYNERKTCALCGASFAQLVQSGKIGCGECYSVFKAELEPTVVKMHGRARHTGKIPKKMEAAIGVKRKIEELNLKLKKLVDAQNFEEAAVVRDEINNLKQREV